MSVYDPERGVVILAVARTPNAMRQRSSLAHELAHTLFSDYRRQPPQGNWSARSSTEIRADAFADTYSSQSKPRAP